MTKCLHPVQAWICGTRVAKDGLLSPNVVFKFEDALTYYNHIGAPHLLEHNQVAMPCGKCAACQVRKRKDWSVRLMHETSQHEQCCFITLTYDDDNVPTTDWRPLDDKDKKFERGLGSLPERTLQPSDVQKFIKRLRRHLEYIPKAGLVNGKSYARNLGVWFDHAGKVRYYAVGEYGSKTRRPHYHIMIFGWSPSDKEVLKVHNGNPVYVSKQLQALWPFGYSTVSDVSPFVARYAARYVTKKFARLNDSPDLTDLSVVPEFTLQSVRNGGIGAPWFDRYGCQSCLQGLCTARCGDRISKYAIPQYYIRRLRKLHPDVFLKVREQRLEFVRGLQRTAYTVHDYERMHEALCRSVEYARYTQSLECSSEYF